MPKRNEQRILLKISGESLMGKNNFGIELKTVDRLAKDLKSLKQQNIQICIVIGGGNIFRGLAAAAKGMDRANADYMGMLATIMNSLALQNALEKIKLDTRVMSALPIHSVCETYIRRRALRHMQKERLVICAAGTGNPYFSTDTAAALRAAELQCSTIYKATQVDGIYNKDPKKFKKSTMIKKMTYDEYLLKNIKVMDNAAITIARENNIPIKVFSILKKDCFKKAFLNKIVLSEVSND